MTDLLNAPDLTDLMPELRAAADRLAATDWPTIKATLRLHVRVIDQFPDLEAFIQHNVDWTGTREGDGLASWRSTADGDMAHRFGRGFVYDVAMVDPAMVFPRPGYPGEEPDRLLCDVFAAALARTGRWHFAPVRLALCCSGHPTKGLEELHAMAQRGERPTVPDGPNQLFPDDGVHRLVCARQLGVPAIGAVIGRHADRRPIADPDLAAAVTWLEGEQRDEMLKRALPELREEAEVAP